MALLTAVPAVSLGLCAQTPDGTPKRLSRLYLVVHALNWLELAPDSPLRQDPRWESWPGRCQTCYEYEQSLRAQYYRLLTTPDEGAAVMFLPSGMKGDPPLIAATERVYGGRCVVTSLDGSREAARAALGDGFVRGLEVDQGRARRFRGGELTEGEIGAWERSKAWACDLRQRLRANGYTFDPATVEVLALGEDWCGCAATYPIHMGRAWGLRQPILRRFDLMNPDCSQALLEASVIEQAIPLPRRVRLYLFRSSEGRWLGQYWEGLHGLYDRPHVALARFAPGTARLVSMAGDPTGNPAGELTIGVGCGGHTPYGAPLVQAEAGASLEDFRQALVSATVRDVP
jgi:hypothetical protein